MTDQPFLITLEQVKEHENGDATYTFDMTETARDAVLEDGLKQMGHISWKEVTMGVQHVLLQEQFLIALAKIDQEDGLI